MQTAEGLGAEGRASRRSFGGRDREWLVQVQVGADSNVHGREALVRHVEERIRAAFERFADQITRIDVHLSDENAAKSGGEDKRCLIEAHLAGHQPAVARHDAATMGKALSGAVTRMGRVLDSTLARSGDHKGAASIRTEEADSSG